MLFTIGYSSFFEVDPQYNKENLEKVFNYKFLGDYLGGLKIKTLVRNEIKNLKDLTKDEILRKGLNYIYKQAKNKNVAIMCAEKSPFDCHRFLAVGSLLHFYTDLKVLNILEEKTLNFDETINWWKEKEKIKNLKISDENLIFQRLNKIYKIDNKREEKFPEKLENLKLFN